MKIQLITPKARSGVDGNQITARRWARMLKTMGHHVGIENSYRGDSCQLLIALHAFKSFRSVRRFRKAHPERPLIVALTGTDLYRDLERKAETRHSLELATRLVVLQKGALEKVPCEFHAKTRVIYQSAERLAGRYLPPKRYFRVCLVGNLRIEKDPFRAALAARRLPVESRIRIVHVGQALRKRMQERARSEDRANRRYRWLGPLSHGRTRALIAGSHVLVLSSRMEGSSNVLSEALVASVPVIVSRIPGLMGTLGEKYAGYFEVGDTQGLACLMRRAEVEDTFYRKLKRQCARAAEVLRPQRERAAWQRLVGEAILEGKM